MCHAAITFPRERCKPAILLRGASHKGLVAGDGTAQDQGMDVVSALIRVYSLQVH